MIDRDDIFLNREIPYIRIRSNKNRKSLKTGGARVRDIPLLGPALEVFKKFPDGFPRYCRPNGSEAFSQAANKIIGEIMSGKSTYSYRHRVADLLRNHPDVKDSMTKALLGHNDGITSKYGNGFTLEQKLIAMNVAFSIDNRKRMENQQAENI